MKKIRTSIAMLLALVLTFSLSVTAFAAEETGTTDTVTGDDQKLLPVYMNYSRDSATTDDTNTAIYNIEIAYDSLEFSFEADTIKWDDDKLDYEVTLKDYSAQAAKGVRITNKSNADVLVEPYILLPLDGTNPKDDGIKFTADLIRGKNELLMTYDSEVGYSQIPLNVPDDYEDCLLSAGSEDNSVNLTVKMANVEIPSTENINNRYIMTLQLDFTGMGLDDPCAGQ